LPVAEGQEVLAKMVPAIIYLSVRTPVFFADLAKSIDIKPVGKYLLLLLRNPGNKLPGPPANRLLHDRLPFIESLE
jgi:hypothetical protein